MHAESLHGFILFLPLDALLQMTNIGTLFAFAMVCETLSRYGCASTAMCYVMHIGAVATIMLRPTDELVDKYIRPLDKDVKIGTLSYSDPETGSHFWYPISSGAERSNGAPATPAWFPMPTRLPLWPR